MKTGERLNRESAFLAKVPVNSRFKRLIWWAFRRYLLNEDHYRLAQRFTGPRPHGTNQVSTTSNNATHRRMYIVARPYKPMPNSVYSRMIDFESRYQGGE